MSEVVDMTNCKIGMWTVLYRTSNDTHGKAVWHCRCECGNEKDISGANLRNKSTLSCGCSHRSHNTFDLSGDYAVGHDNSGNSFLFDKEEYSKIKPYYWRVGSNKYVSMVIYDRNTKKCTQYLLHRFLMNPTSEEEVDHINHNTLDNRKSNLRIVTTAQNQMNSVVSDRNRSGVKGVNWDNNEQRWRVRISVSGKRLSLGSYKNFDDAVQCRKSAEAFYYGEYKYVNLGS